MNLASIRLITDDVTVLADFYSRVTGSPVDRLHELFAEVRVGSCVVAIGHSSTVALFASGSAEPAANRTAIVEFLVDDVDALYPSLAAWIPAFVTDGPKTMPWGNRALLFRDPDGNLVNLFTPVTPEAVARFAGVPR